MEQYADKPAYVTLKDHKENFKTKLPCRLINPAKSELGIVSKVELEKINKELVNITKCNQWRNTQIVIDWFKLIPNKPKAKFIKFDIAEFYPSITERLLDNALTYAQTLITIDHEIIQLIKHSRKSLLFTEGNIWMKKGENPLFDVTMGSSDGAELCEFVGIYLLGKLSRIIDSEDIGLYRDDGLASIKNANGPKLDRLRKDIIAIFQNEGLKITIDTNLTTTDFLDVTLDLNTGKYYPYRKPNDRPLYVNTDSNHPPTILKQLPKMINSRLSSLSVNEEEFNKAKPLYETALISSGFNESLKFENVQSKQPRNRLRKVIWFNPPYNVEVKTNIGKIFLKLVRKHFNKRHRYRKLFNTNSIKLSYSCTPNIKNLIKQHNISIMKGNNETEKRECNCRNKSNCPLDGKCLSECIVYEATVTTINNHNVYFGLADGTFKSRYNNHTKSFRLRTYEHETELSKHIWSLKDKNIEYTLNWRIKTKAVSYKCGSRKCDLCLAEKVAIARFKGVGLLNKRTELLSKCRHRNKFLIANVK